MNKYMNFICYCPKYSFFWYPCHVLPIELLEPSCTSSSLPLDRKYQTGNSRDNYIILLYYMLFSYQTGYIM